MAFYAQENIPNHTTITKIPSGHLPTDINTSTAQNWSYAFYGCENITSLPDPFYDTSNAINMTTMLYECENLTTIPNFNTKNVTSMDRMLYRCRNINTIPNFDTSNVVHMNYMCYLCQTPNTVPIFNISSAINLCGIFQNCYNMQGDLYIESNNVIDAYNVFGNTPNYVKNIYVHANTTTYNTIYKCMSNRTYYSYWNTYLYTMEDNYAYIRIGFSGGFDEPVYKIFRFPTNKIAVIRRNTSDPSGASIIKIIEVTPYTDYNIAITQDDLDGWISHNGVSWGSSRFTTSSVIQGFRFFKDITNMTPDIVDTI